MNILIKNIINAMDGESYDDALSIICEYVNPVDKKEYDRKNERKTKPREW